MLIRHGQQRRFKAIGWLLIAAVFAFTVQPMHVHLQHVDDASSLLHEHAIDLHFAVADIDPAHHDDAAVFPVTPDVMLKKLGDNPLLATILVGLSLVLLNLVQTSRHHLPVRYIRCRPGWFCITPPLRAPPRI